MVIAYSLILKFGHLLPQSPCSIFHALLNGSSSVFPSFSLLSKQSYYPIVHAPYVCQSTFASTFVALLARVRFPTARLTDGGLGCTTEGPKTLVSRDQKTGNRGTVKWTDDGADGRTEPMDGRRGRDGAEASFLVRKHEGIEKEEKECFESRRDRSMGRWEVSVSSEMFDRQKKESSNSCVAIAIEQPWTNATRDDKKLLTTELPAAAAAAEEEHTMCNGDGVIAREEWSPIRDPPPAAAAPQLQTYNRFAGGDDGASSDMDTEEDAPPPRVSAKIVAAAAPAVEGLGERDAVAGVFDYGGAGLGTGFGTTAGEPKLKRKRLPDLGRNPVVQVTYEGLTRESKNVLQLALQNWSYWHSRSYPASVDSTKAVLEGGTEVYSPALTLEPTSNACAISVWMDKPSKNQEVENQDIQDGITLENRDKEKEVPIYDRACISALSSQDLADRCDGYVSIEPEEASRCFNCGSYSHSLRNCSRPHAVATIKNARNMLLNKKGSLPRSRTSSRYYHSSPGGKFDDLKPGILGLDTRKGLGIREWDPPPWLNRMREIGCPPGYLEDAEDDCSGVEIIGEDKEAVIGKEIIEDDNIVEKSTPTVSKVLTAKRMIVEYPGINAPIPENADKKLWAPLSEAQAEQTSRGAKRSFHQISQVHNRVDCALGSNMLSPSSSANSWGLGMLDADSRDGSTSRSTSNGHLENSPRNGSDGVESYADGSSSSSQGIASVVVSSNVSLLVDPANYWAKRQASGARSPAAEGSDYAYTRSAVPGFQHSPSRPPSGLASPLRGLLRTPGSVEPSPSPPHIYFRQNYYHSQLQASPLPSPQSAKENANEAWLKAQAALDALQPTQNSGGLLAKPLQTAVAAQQCSGSTGSPHGWGRM